MSRKSKSLVKSQPAPAPQSLRRSKRYFRFDKNRDDHNLKGETAYVFTTQSPMLDGGDIGVYGAPCGVLMGYAPSQDGNGARSVVLRENSRVMGRLVEVTMEELAHLDTVAEHSGSDLHRFKADVILPQAGVTVQAWVFQRLSDATEVEFNTSAAAKDEPDLNRAISERLDRAVIKHLTNS